MQAQQLGLYLSPPGEQVSTRPGAITETFNRGASGIGASGNWAIGTYTASSGAYANADQYGGAGGVAQYLAVGGGTIHVTVVGERRYIGFWWSAGNAPNSIAFYDNNNNLLATFTTASLRALLTGPGNVTAIDGNQYPKAAYFGNPNPPAGRNMTEPYGYVNLIIEGASTTFGRVVMTGTGFELDNLSIATTATPSGTWVDYGEIPIVLPTGAIGATDDTANTPQNTPFSGNVATNDTTVPGSTFALSGPQPANGNVVLNPDGTYTYSPNPGLSGKDSFTYMQCKPAPDQAVCVTAKVTMVVQPDAVDDSAATVVGVPVGGSVAGNDSVPAGSTFSLSSGQPANGSVVFQADGSYTYTPNPGYSGTDSFNYRACLPPPDATACDVATVTITVAPQSVPVASNVSATGTPQAGQPISGIYTYSDVNGDVEGASTFRWVRSPTTSLADGTQVSDAISYTPTAGDAGRHLFFCVTPVAATGASPGVEVCSPAVQAAPQALVAPTSIPTLSEWGMLVLAALMALGAWLGMRPRA